MLDFLERLRAKPEKTRKKIALTITASIMLVIFIFWIVALVWKIEHMPVDSSNPSESLSSDISNFFDKAQAAAPNVSF